MKRIEILEIGERHMEGFVPYVEFQSMEFRHSLSGFSQVFDPKARDGFAGVTTYREPVQMHCTTNEDGTINENYFVIGPQLRKALGWNEHMKQVEESRNSAKMELTQIKEKNARLNKWNDRLHAMLKNCQEELYEFKSMPWYRRVLSAIRNDRVVHHHD